MTRTIRRGGEHELIVNRSRFLCALAKVADEAAARGFVAARRKDHWGASHHCTAYVLGEDASVARSSDDGEPAGTAGIPMLDVLRHRELTNVVAVVTRYFGGVKLGTGGLVRAYGRAVAEAVDAVGTVRLVRHAVVVTTIGYDQGPRLEAALRDGGRNVIDVAYGAEVTVTVALPETDVSEFRDWLAARSAGDARVEVTGDMIAEVPD